MLCAYHSDIKSFIVSCNQNRISIPVSESFYDRFGFIPGDSEQKSWQASLPAFAKVLSKPEFGNSDIFIEMQMPLSSARCDVIVAGISEKNEPFYVVIELKQWSGIRKSAIRDTVPVGGGGQWFILLHRRNHT